MKEVILHVDSTPDDTDPRHWSLSQWEQAVQSGAVRIISSGQPTAQVGATGTLVDGIDEPEEERKPTVIEREYRVKVKATNASNSDLTTDILDNVLRGTQDAVEHEMERQLIVDFDIDADISFEDVVPTPLFDTTPA